LHKVFKFKDYIDFMIILLTGKIGSGKGIIADHLESKGYQRFTYSDVLREEAKKRGFGTSRVDLQHLGNELREESKDNGFLSLKIIAKIKKVNVVADGVRNPDEIKVFRKNKEIIVIGVDASQQIRFERMKSRKRSGDPTSFDEFKEIDDKENSGKSYGQDINACLKLSDYIIKNEKSIENLKKAVDLLIKTLGSK
jgi:dephospho-CoA kinase